MPGNRMQLAQIVSYVEPLLKKELRVDRERAEKRAGHRISESKYVAQILQRHIAKRTA